MITETNMDRVIDNIVDEDWHCMALMLETSMAVNLQVGMEVVLVDIQEYRGYTKIQVKTKQYDVCFWTLSRNIVKPEK